MGYLKRRREMKRLVVIPLLALVVLFCSNAKAQIAAEKNFVGTVSDFTYTGAVQNTNEIPIGSQVSGTYMVEIQPYYDTEKYVVTATYSIQGISGVTYEIPWTPADTMRSLSSLSPDGQNIDYKWNEQYFNVLLPLYFPPGPGYPTSWFIYDINNFASENFSGTGTIYGQYGSSAFALSYTMASVPEPSILLLLAPGLAAVVMVRRKLGIKG
jgi:hypothetical protein